MKFKSHIALFLLVLISVKTLLVPVVYLDFELRRDFIIQNLCENRFKPQLRCKGQCYLAKKLHKIDEDNATKETQRQGQSIKKIMEEVFAEAPIFSCEWSVKTLSKKSIYSYQLAHSEHIVSSLFHPPII